MKDNQLFNASLIFFLIIITGLLISIYARTQKGYKTANKEVLEYAISQEYLMKYYEFLKKDRNEIFIVDLRMPEIFEMSNIENSVNIPADKLLEKASLKKLKKQKKEIVLLSDSENTSVLCMLLLHSSGIENLRVLAGNYDKIKNFVIDSPDPSHLFYDSEKQKWNYGNFMQRPQAPTVDFAPHEDILVDGGC